MINGVAPGGYEHQETDPHTARTIPYAVNRPRQSRDDCNHSQLLKAHAMTVSELREVKRLIGDFSKPVDEYQVQTTTPKLDNNVLTLTPQFQKLNVRVENIVITGPAIAQLNFQNQAPVVAPLANGNILQVGTGALPPAGPYLLNWTLGLTGTPGAGENNNVKIVGPPIAGILQDSVNPGVVGDYPQESVQITIPPNNATSLSAKAVGAGTAGAGYTVGFALSPVGGTPVTLQLGDRTWDLFIPPTGILSIPTKCLLLSPQDTRTLTAAFPGEYTLEVMGFADERL